MSAGVATLPLSSSTSSAPRGLVSVSAVPISIFSTRPSRSVARVNYAEASDESLGGGGGSGRKRKASAFSAAAPRSMPQRPKSLLKMLNNSAAGKRSGGGAKKGSDSDESDESESEAEEEDEENVKSGSKALRGVDFGAAKKKQTSGPTPKYVTNFVIACEQICVRDAKLLAAFHVAVRKVPLNTPAALPQIVDAFNKVLTPRVVERVRQQRAHIDEWMDRHVTHSSVQLALTFLLSFCFLFSYRRADSDAAEGAWSSRCACRHARCQVCPHSADVQLRRLQA